MAGILFDYFDGYLRVEFQHGPWFDHVQIIFHLSGDTVATTPCDDDFQKGEPEIYAGQDVTLRCWTSSCESWFFRAMVNWLEAVTRDVAECAFFWDGEGPEGEMRWFGGFRDSGRLHITWSGSKTHNWAAIDHGVRLNKAQMVRALYQSFREFVESDHYNPIAYEKLSYSEVFDLVVTDGREALIQEIAASDSPQAFALIETIADFVYDSRETFPRRAGLSEFKQLAQTYWQDKASEQARHKERMDALLDPAWNNWSTEQRRSHVQQDICPWHCLGGHGEKLSTLRSPLIENWLQAQDEGEVNGLSADSKGDGHES